MMMDWRRLNGTSSILGSSPSVSSILSSSPSAALLSASVAGRDSILGSSPSADLLSASVAGRDSLVAEVARADGIVVTEDETNERITIDDGNVEITVPMGELHADNATISGVETVRDAVPKEKAEPPKFAELVGWFLLPRQDREGMLGDWAEDYPRLLNKYGPIWARAYCWWDVIRSVLQARLRRIETLAKIWKRISRLGL